MGKDKKPTKPGHLLKEHPVTYETYAKLPDDGTRYEINNGRLEAMTPGSSVVHQLVIKQILYCVDRDCLNEYVVIPAPFDLILSLTEVRQPDLVMIHRNRLEIITGKGIEGSPDLVVEVLSPHSAKRDRQQKLHAYAKYNIPEYWIVDINNELLEQYLLDGDQYYLSEVYKEKEPVLSARLACISFTMQEIIDSIPELPNF
ncbi:MAG: Uma2 family endonuclease [Dethiobacter sp.]|nr:Uma2 family endonuclease [Dethiobacter sp.]MBS3901576.1 Uma2 family endonuclease [Dethiobacter sp.]MBS3989402.1 Uma2 family endonuclease [Dethiobacter sp.]